MSELKFRAWCIPKKEMFEVVCVYYDGGCKSFPHSDYFNHNEVKLMQFTGLKTRDKKEIYEGDIVICRDGKGLIIYEPRFAKFLIDFAPQNKNRLIDCEDAFRHEDADTCMRSIRVIGNMYENPELLKHDAEHAEGEK